MLSQVSPPSSKSVPLGTMVGTPILGSIDYFVTKYGPAAGHELVRRMGERWPASEKWLDPHARTLGILGARKYPLSFVGDLMRNAAIVARAPNEDTFVRDLASAGIDAAVGTVQRVLLRYAASPTALAERAQTAWDMFFDTGRILAVAGEREYSVTISEWTGHDPWVCRIAMEVRRRLIERTGKTHVEARREKCVSFGHDVCVVRVKW